ncbi:hypothetical protein HAX54_028454 [Datura stramonium]|uniref:GST C-terminal domain-containing protein n=1 Tax=Datura stramonium TaxID=4076 RepID=A0ABS8RL84_DATST|nr:hypothetical protein [Datura stramonium]
MGPTSSSCPSSFSSSPRQAAPHLCQSAIVPSWLSVVRAKARSLKYPKESGAPFCLSAIVPSWASVVGAKVCKDHLVKLLEEVEVELGETSYLAGAEFNLADVMLILILGRVELLKLEDEYIQTRSDLADY